MVQLIIKKFFAYVRYHLKEKWRFIYFELDLNSPVFSLPTTNGNIVIRLAQKKDLPRIEADIYPHLTSNEENDKQYIANIGEKNFQCFIAEHANKIVHYFLLSECALSSPLIKTPFDKSRLSNADAYLTSTFTIPEARGLWIVPQTILKIIKHLKTSTSVQRLLVLVHPSTPGAVAFYQRLGFRIIKDAYRKGLISSLFLSMNENKR